MYIKQLQENWEIFGKEDPLWAICTDHSKRFNNWDEQEFFETGSAVIDRAIIWMDESGYPKQRRTALDFGCGVGRLTQPLCDHFKTCIGVDIASSMIELAREYNTHGKNCIYHHNENDNLSCFKDDTFDLVFTEHVLQHIHPAIAKRYVAEFIRVLRPGGLARFHCPSAMPTFAYPPENISAELHPLVESVTIKTGGVAVVPVRITNTGDHPIGGQGQINAPVRIFSHWISKATGELLKRHNYMNPPETIIQPGESMEYTCKVPSPPQAGNYALALTPGDHLNRDLPCIGNNIPMVDAEVLPLPKHLSPKTEVNLEKRPQFEVYAIPVQEIEAVITKAGGQIIKIDSTRQNVPGGLEGTRYFVTK